jgi:hypothetical protein
MQRYSVPMVPRSLWARARSSRWTPILLFACVLVCYFLVPIYRSYDFDEALEATRTLASPPEGGGGPAWWRLLERALVVQSRGMLASVLGGLVIGLLGLKTLPAPVAAGGLLVAGALALVAAVWPLLQTSTVHLSNPCLPPPRPGPGVILLVSCPWDRPLPAFWALLALLVLASLNSALLLVRELRGQRVH